MFKVNITTSRSGVYIVNFEHMLNLYFEQVLVCFTRFKEAYLGLHKTPDRAPIELHVIPETVNTCDRL